MWNCHISNPQICAQQSTVIWEVSADISRRVCRIAEKNERIWSRNAWRYFLMNAIETSYWDSSSATTIENCSSLCEYICAFSKIDILLCGYNVDHTSICRQIRTFFEQDTDNTQLAAQQFTLISNRIPQNLSDLHKLLVRYIESFLWCNWWLRALILL